MNSIISAVNRAATADLANLSMMHTANGEDFLSILDSRVIKATKCKVFSPDLLSYFFLGRPAYKTTIVQDPSFWQLPAIFAMRNSKKWTPKRIYPFDSGAHEMGRYADIIGRIERDEFLLSNDCEIAGKTITYFFENVERYIAARAIPYEIISKRLSDDLRSFPALALSKLYNHPYNDAIDDRVKLIELQFDQDIPIDQGDLKAVIICKEWLRDPKIRDSLDALGCKICTYPIMPLSSANYYSKIYEISEGL